MHAPPNAMPLPFPVHLKPYIVGQVRATRGDLRETFGEPHFRETDGTRTAGGDEDNWGWELANGHRILFVLHVPYEDAFLYCDPPDASVLVDALGIDPAKDRLQILDPPVLDPRYSGPR